MQRFSRATVMHTNAGMKETTNMSKENTVSQTSHSTISLELARRSFWFDKGMDGIDFNTKNDSRIFVETINANIMLPDTDFLIVENLNFTVNCFQNTLIAGPSGAGKVNNRKIL